jgi:hypothetical protein
MWNTTDARSHSTCWQAWTSLNHRKNVLLCVNRSSRLPFRAHRNTWKTTIFPQWLVTSSKYTSRRKSSSIGETSSIFFYSSSRITISKTIYKMHVAIFHARKYERHSGNSVHQRLTIKPLRVLYHLEENARKCISSEHTEIRRPADCYLSWIRRKSTIFNYHYLVNRSTLYIGVLGFFGIV